VQRFIRSLLPAPGRAAAAALGLLLAGAALHAHAAEPKLYLEQRFGSLRASFGSTNQEKASIRSGPVPVKMLRGASPGKAWQIALAGLEFRVTIEDKITLDLTNALARVQQLPQSYLSALVIVSEPGKDGLAFYQNLDGAAAHGGQDYLNLVRDADAAVIAHECGHILEQRARQSDPKLLDRWKTAADDDKVSVSGYGDSANHEDLAEFAFVYALCADAGKLAELKKLSPARFALWEEILKKNRRILAWD
jgi:hypothetical protein